MNGSDNQSGDKTTVDSGEEQVSAIDEAGSAPSGESEAGTAGHEGELEALAEVSDEEGEIDDDRQETVEEGVAAEDDEQALEHEVVIPELKQILEAAILANASPLSVDNMLNLFPDAPRRTAIREALAEIEGDYEGRGFELKQVASGYRFQVRPRYSQWIGRLWEEKPPRYSRALLETLALVAYKQPLTRGDIEEIRGVAVSSNIVRTLLEREWVRIVGHRDVPGRPALYATTRNFLDYFNLSSLDELPTLSEIKDLDKLNPELDLEEEVIPPRSLELATESDTNPEEGAAAQLGEDGAMEAPSGTGLLEDEDPEEAVEELGIAGLDVQELNEVTDRVNQIQENIKNLFAPPVVDVEEDFDDDEEGLSTDVSRPDETNSSEPNAPEVNPVESNTTEAASDDSSEDDSNRDGGSTG